MTKLYKQPFFHFLLAGALIFIVYGFSKQPAVESQPADKVIDVDRETLLTFMQYRAQAFDPEIFNERLDAMNEEERAALIDDYVREEALYREALAMGMDRGDYNIRQRLVQKVEFLLENAVNEDLPAGDEDIRSFYEERKSDYRVDSVYTFTHIFFDAGDRGWDTAKQEAEDLLAGPDIGGILFNDASQYGDRYPFLQNYVERTRDFVVNNFTEEFVEQLDDLTPSEDTWYGPFQSRYGWHLVMLRARTEPYVPELDDIRGRVVDDYRYETALKKRKEAESQVVSGYTVNIDLDKSE